MGDIICSQCDCIFHPSFIKEEERQKEIDEISFMDYQSALPSP